MSFIRFIVMVHTSIVAEAYAPADADNEKIEAILGGLQRIAESCGGRVIQS